MSTIAATSHDEEPFWFAVGDRDLLGIVTHPTVPPLGIGLVICSSGHWVTTIGPNRFHVTLARRFSKRGFHSLRFDYGGIGESTGPARPYRLQSPFSKDAVAAAACLTALGVPEVVLLGSCYGARTALVAATEIGPVRGVALYPPPVRDYEHGERVASLPSGELIRRVFRRSTLVGLLDPRERRRYARIGRRRLSRLRRRLGGGTSPGFEWVSRSFVEPLESLIGRRVPVLIVYGEDDDFYADFTRNTGGPIPAMIARAGDLLTIDVVPGRTHGLGSIEVQEAVLASVDRWLVALPDIPVPKRA